MEVGFSPVSIIAYAARTIASAVASQNSVTEEAVGGIGAGAQALFSGFEIKGAQKNMLDDLSQTMERSWNSIQKKYELTDSCMKELKEEIMGKSTTREAFIRNSENRGLESAIAIVIENILLKHVNEFKRSAKHTWTKGYTKNASVKIACILIESIEEVFKKNDFLIILKTIMDSDAKRRQDYQEMSSQFDLIKEEIKHNAGKEVVFPKCLTCIPAINQTIGLVGRDDVVKTLRELLNQKNSLVLISGLGGIGKTAVLQYICNDLKNDGKYVAWIKCGESIKKDLLILRNALNIPEVDDVDTAYGKIIDEIKRNPQFASEFYLFMDNLSYVLSDKEQSELNGLGIHVMATSRFEHDYFINLTLGVLAELPALDMFYSYYLEKQKDKTHRYKDAALDIIESVKGHTLLVELLAKAAWKKGGTLESFRDELKSKGVYEVFKRKLSTKQYKNKTIEECVMELYRIIELTPAQQRIMKLFTLFTPEKEIYYKVSEWAALDIDALDELVDIGWLEKGGIENGFFIHKIVKDSLTSQMKKDFEKVKLEDYGNFLSKVIDTDSYLGKEATHEVVIERLVLTEDIVRFFCDEGREDAEAGALYNNIAVVYEGQGDYEKALEFYGKSLEIRERILGTYHMDTATTFNNMGRVYEAKGSYEKALEYYRKALEIREKVPGMNHQDTGATYNNIAGVYETKGDYKKALEYYEKALSIFEKELGEEHSTTTTLYNNLAGVYYTQGDYKKALEYYGKSLKIRERVLGVNHQDTATSYNNIANVYYAQDDYQKALEYYEKALAIRERMLGEEHPDTGMTYNNLAGVYYAIGAYDKALDYNGKALEIFERMLGEEHPLTATMYNNFAKLYETKGDCEEALQYYGKALAIRERVLGTDHLDTAVTYNNIAGVFRAQGNYEKALEYYEKAVVIRERELGTENSVTAGTYNNMGGVFRAQGNYEKALEYYGKALAIRERVFGEEHPTTAGTYNNIALVYKNQGDYKKALDYNEKSRAIYELVLGKNHKDTAVTYNNMAEVFYAQGDYCKALEYYRKANNIFLSVFGDTHSFTQDTALSIKNMEHLLETGGLEDGTNGDA